MLTIMTLGIDCDSIQALHNSLPQDYLAEVIGERARDLKAVSTSSFPHLAMSDSHYSKE